MLNKVQYKLLQLSSLGNIWWYLESSFHSGRNGQQEMASMARSDRCEGLFDWH